MLAGQELRHRILSTSVMAMALGLKDTDWVSGLCLRGVIKGAWRIGSKGFWRVHSSDFRDYLEAEGISTRVLDEYLAR